MSVVTMRPKTAGTLKTMRAKLTQSESLRVFLAQAQMLSAKPDPIQIAPIIVVTATPAQMPTGMQRVGFSPESGGRFTGRAGRR
jgi:hypothetical protein